MKYKIYSSTGTAFTGIKFECEHGELCIECLKIATGQPLARNKIEREGSVYIYADKHILLLIKEVN